MVKGFEGDGPSPKEMGMEGEKTPEETIKEKGAEYFNEMLNPPKDTFAFVGGKEEFLAYMRFHLENIEKGDFFNPVQFKAVRDGQSGTVTQKSTYEFLTGALKKYELWAGKFAKDKPEVSEDYKRRAEMVKAVIQAMEQDPRFSEMKSKEA